MKKLVELIPSLNPIGGGQTLFVNLCEELVLKHSNLVDLTVVILYAKKDNYLYKKIESLGCKIIYLNKKKGVDVKCSIKLRHIIEEINPDIIHSHLATSVTLYISQLLKKKRTIYHTIHHMVGPEYIKERFNIYLCKKKFLNPVCVCKKSSLSLKKYINREVPFVNNGIKVSDYNDVLDYDKRANQIVCIASFTPIKNHNYLLDIMKDFFLSKNNDSWQLLLIGDGPLKDEIKNKIKELHLDNKIKMTGDISNINEILSNSKILVLASKSEGNPMVINEAIASSVFVVANDVGGISDIITDNANGFLVEPNNKLDFVDKLNKATYLKSFKSSKPATSISDTANEYLKLFGVI